MRSTPKFDGLLHRQVHLFTGLQRLHQRNRKRRFTLRGKPFQTSTLTRARTPSIDPGTDIPRRPR
jgi:hypothetical protein